MYLYPKSYVAYSFSFHQYLCIQSLRNYFAQCLAIPNITTTYYYLNYLDCKIFQGWGLKTSEISLFLSKSLPNIRLCFKMILEIKHFSVSSLKSSMLIFTFVYIHPRSLFEQTRPSYIFLCVYTPIVRDFYSTRRDGQTNDRIYYSRYFYQYFIRFRCTEPSKQIAAL